MESCLHDAHLFSNRSSCVVLVICFLSKEDSGSLFVFAAFSVLLVASETYPIKKQGNNCCKAYVTQKRVKINPLPLCSIPSLPFVLIFQPTEKCHLLSWKFSSFLGSNPHQKQLIRATMFLNQDVLFSKGLHARLQLVANPSLRRACTSYAGADSSIKSPLCD